MTDNIYGSLREWHLARLRNLAKAEAEQTPAKLIASDREEIRRLIEETASSCAAIHPEQRQDSKLASTASLWILVQILSICLCTLKTESIYSGFLYYLNSSFGTLAAGLTTHPSLASFEARFSFAGVYVLLAVISCIAPVKWFQTKRNNKSTKHLHTTKLMAGILLAGLLIHTAVFLMQLKPSGSYGECMLAVSSWSLLFISAVLIQAKLIQNQLSESAGILKSIENEISAETDGQQEQDPVQTAFRIKEELKELLQKERAIADYSKTVLLSFDRNLSIDAVSPSVQNQLGFSIADLINRNLGELILIDDLNRFQELLPSAKEGAPFQVDLRIKSSGGLIKDYQIHLDWSSKFERYFAACNDISDRAALERARQEYILQLTHDMRAPLTSVRILLELFSEGLLGKLPHEDCVQLTSAESGLSRILKLIDAILDAESLPHKELNRKDLSLPELCRNVVEELAGLAEKRKVEIILQGENIELSADEKLLSRAVSNLISNAVSFSPAGGKVVIKITGKDREAIVSVKDDGPGIHPDYQKSIFERYKPRMPKSDQGRASAGLGLWICRQIINAHGGSIRVESEPGKGSKFTFTVPMQVQ